MISLHSWWNLEAKMVLVCELVVSSKQLWLLLFLFGLVQL